MSTTHPVAAAVSDEFETVPVPPERRKSVWSVSAVWAGFPMIITGASTGAALVHGLGFASGLLAMIIGNILLFGYVGVLSGLAAKTGLNFPLQASRTFGRTGYVVCSALLSTLVLGWFAVQSGLVGASMNGVFGVNAAIIALIAGALFTAVTLLGIRALTIIGAVSVPLFVVLGLVAAVQATAGGVDVWSYQGNGSGSIVLGVGITLVFALFADSGTMTADFTRWAKTPRQAWVATSTAFPIGNFFAMVIGGVIAAAAAGSGDLFGIIAGGGGLMSLIAVLFLFINLGSVCTHCLYNAAVGWSAILRLRMRPVTLGLGAIGVVLAALGAWSFFIDWLNLLGVIVPPIGMIIIIDQLARRSAQTVTRAFRWQSFAAWALGSGAALLAHFLAPGLSVVIVGLVVAAAAYALFTILTRGEDVAATSQTA